MFICGCFPLSRTKCYNFEAKQQNFNSNSTSWLEIWPGSTNPCPRTCLGRCQDQIGNMSTTRDLMIHAKPNNRFNKLGHSMMSPCHEDVTYSTNKAIQWCHPVMKMWHINEFATCKIILIINKYRSDGKVRASRRNGYQHVSPIKHLWLIVRPHTNKVLLFRYQGLTELRKTTYNYHYWRKQIRSPTILPTKGRNL